MGGSKRGTAQNEFLHETVAVVADGNGQFERTTKTAEHIEVWVLVANVGGTNPVIDIIYETFVEGIGWVPLVTFAAVAVNSLLNAAFSRSNGDAIGQKARLRFANFGGTDTPTFTITAKQIRKE